MKTNLTSNLSRSAFHVWSLESASENFLFPRRQDSSFKSFSCSINFERKASVSRTLFFASYKNVGFDNRTSCAN